MNRVIAVVVGLLVLSAGCIGGSEFPSELGQPAVEEHAASLSDAESYTAEVTMQFSRGTASSGGTVVYRVDNEEERFYTRQDIDAAIGGVSTEKYTDAELTAQRSEMSFSDEYIYRYGEPPYEDGFGGVRPVNASGAERGIVDGLGNETMPRNGTTEYRGETVGVYSGGSEFIEAVRNQTRTAPDPTGSLNVPTMGGDGDSAINLTNGSVTVYLGTDGIIRYQQLRLVHQQRDEPMTIEITYRVRGVNNTTVERPTWIDEARESNSSSGFGGGLF